MTSHMTQARFHQPPAFADPSPLDPELAALVLVHVPLDEEQIALFRSKFHILFKGYLGLVWKVLWKEGARPPELYDLSQDVFNSFFVDTIRDGFPLSIPAKLRSLAAGDTWNELRRVKNCRLSFGAPPSSASEKPRSSPDLDRAMDLAEVVRRFVPALSQEDREVIEAVDLRGLTQEEAAAELGINRNTLAAQLMRARAKLAVMVKRFLPESQR